ncbi:zinc ribbon domain-containing protein [Tautonia sociabilis]|uniref:Uncharacterized protein n=1 Tax=Tautonia sociabilis TaxID=2080755 RepID=A0A432ML76_9BACT|nr:hypothetical protein [Tautonia sociabilis]RUL88030.1 hypothetical protein TsocGM_08790 [Tautonia sociabilis]
MGSSLAFGCPECGRRIDLDRNSRGRRVKCGRCGTLVEVPFFPRRFGRRRSNRRRRAWLAVGLVAMAMLAVPTIGWQWWQSSSRRGQAAELTRVLARLDEAERHRDLASALLAADEARALASRYGLDPPGGPEALADRRDEIARRDAEARLEALAGLAPDLAADEAIALLDRSGSDPALEAMSGRILADAAAALSRWADHHLVLAEQARDDGRPVEALARARLLAERLSPLPTASSSGALRRVRSFAAGLVAARGARVGPISLAGSPSPEGLPPIDCELPPILADALARRGYLPPDPDSPLADLWDASPFLLRATIDRKPGPNYLQSFHRTTLFSVALCFERDGQPAWSEAFDARTRIPLPGLSALESSRLALGGPPSDEVALRFERDARIDLLEKLVLKLSALPPAPAP